MSSDESMFHHILMDNRNNTAIKMKTGTAANGMRMQCNAVEHLDGVADDRD